MAAMKNKKKKTAALKIGKKPNAKAKFSLVSTTIQNALGFFVSHEPDFVSAFSTLKDSSSSAVLNQWQQAADEAAASGNMKLLENLYQIRRTVLPLVRDSFQLDWREPIGVHYLPALAKGGVKTLRLLQSRSLYPLDFCVDAFLEFKGVTVDDIRDFQSIFFENECASEWSEIEFELEERFPTDEQIEDQEEDKRTRLQAEATDRKFEKADKASLEFQTSQFIIFKSKLDKSVTDNRSFQKILFLNSAKETDTVIFITAMNSQTEKSLIAAGLKPGVHFCSTFKPLDSVKVWRHSSGKIRVKA